MLLAKLALGFCGTVAVAGAYSFHEGVMRVDEDHSGGRHVHVWFPAAIVPLALHVVPSRHLEHPVAQVGPWLPTLRALTKELKRYPKAALLEAYWWSQPARIRRHTPPLRHPALQP